MILYHKVKVLNIFGLFGFGMKFFVDLFEVLVGDMSVNLGGRNVGVAKHGLDGAEVGAVHEKVSSEAVAESVRRNMFRNAGFAGVFLDNALDRAGGEATIIA